MRYFTWFALIAALGSLFWTALGQMASRWAVDPSYTHGFLVPLFSLYLLWHRRPMFLPSAPALGWGFVLIGLATGLMVTAAALFFQTLAHYSLPLFLAGVCLALGGWQKLKWAWPSLAFLFFMVPLPGPVADALGGPLQHVATVASTYVIQTVGVPAVAEGNVILLSTEPIGVAEACSGLRMLVLFVAIAAGFVLLVDRKPWEKLLLLASSIPIAIIANVTRITLTAMMYEWVSENAAQLVFHDLAGWLMMPLAIALLAAEATLLSSLVIENRPAAPVALGLGRNDPSPIVLPGVGRSAPPLRSPRPSPPRPR
ncbi:MAG TPA: exosortase/archaeosortase family protein [Pirellulales bacterium]|nr:exosortase/archaeosortase family protein [Pirellulales bacterium]